jgi:rare lipoprotein A
MAAAGVANVRVRYVGPATKTPFDQRRMIASAPPPPEPRYAPPPKTRVYATGLPPAQPAYGPPPPPAADPDYAPSAPPAAWPTRAIRPASAYRVQAGSFANRDNAERAVAQLSGAGEASIESIQRARACSIGWSSRRDPDEAEAFGVRDRVAALGFSDATVLRP